MFSQELTEKSLLAEMNKRLPQKKLLGSYLPHKGLSKLAELNKRDDFNIEDIGFFIEYGLSFSPAPFDIIPFGYTGGDGCYFAFLTDFGYHKNLEDCPIVFISPTDFNVKKPAWANILFAKNFEDFLSLMIQINFVDIIRFEDLSTLNFSEKIKEIHAELDHFPKTTQSRKSTIQIIRENFKLNKIPNLNDYFTDLKCERESINFLILKDAINLELLSIDRPIEKLSAKLNSNELKDWLNRVNLNSRLAFYRESPYIYQYWKNDYIEILKTIKKQLKEDGFQREVDVLEEEIRYTMLSQKYREIRKKKIRDKD